MPHIERVLSPRAGTVALRSWSGSRLRVVDRLVFQVVQKQNDVEVGDGHHGSGLILARRPGAVGRYALGSITIAACHPRTIFRIGVSRCSSDRARGSARTSTEWQSVVGNPINCAIRYARPANLLIITTTAGACGRADLGRDPGRR